MLLLLVLQIVPLVELKPHSSRLRLQKSLRLQIVPLVELKLRPNLIKRGESLYLQIVPLVELKRYADGVAQSWIRAPNCTFSGIETRVRTSSNCTL